MPSIPISETGVSQLIVIPNVPAREDGDGFFLDIKAVEGLEAYAQSWPGPVRAIFRLSDSPNVYSRRYRRDELPFDLQTLPNGVPASAAAALIDGRAGPAIILAGADDHRDFGLVGLAAPNPVVFIIEYDLGTRLAILKLERVGLLRKARRLVWLLLRERERRAALRDAVGIQANGRPAFEAYAGLSANPLLYFDTRLGQDHFIGDGIDAKIAAMLTSAPLRLAFSGRLEPMKGADHLVPVARALAERGVDFTLDILGEGSLGDSMRAEAMRDGLGERIRFRGAIPFESELVPMMQGEIDLFLCCHRQSDPSCTYLETLGCGVPIAGYLNDAFAGVLALGTCGVGVPLDDVAALADAVAELDRDRQRLAALMRGAATVASTRLFEQVFAERIAHLRRIAEAS